MEDSSSLANVPLDLVAVLIQNRTEQILLCWCVRLLHHHLARPFAFLCFPVHNFWTEGCAHPKYATQIYKIR
jgi:hypothetical protein